MAHMCSLRGLLVHFYLVRAVLSRLQFLIKQISSFRYITTLFAQQLTEPDLPWAPCIHNDSPQE